MDYLHSTFDDVEGMFDVHKGIYYNNTKTVEEVISSCITFNNMVSLITNNRDKFNFSSISNEHKALLLSRDYDTFSAYVSAEKLPLIYQVDLFIQMPDKLKSFIDFSKITKDYLAKIAKFVPSCFKKYDIPVRNMPPEGWRHLLAYNKMHTSDFLENIQHIRDKSKLRHLIEHHTYLVPLLTSDAMDRSILSAKEWILFLSWQRVSELKLVYNKYALEWLDAEFSCEVLAGTQKQSRQTKDARKLIKALTQGLTKI